MNVKNKKFPGFYVLAGSMLVLFYSACNNSTNTTNSPSVNTPKTEQKVNLVQYLLADKNHLFRSVDLGTDPQSVLSTETKLPDEKDSADIIYTLPLDTIHPDSVNEAIDSVNYFTVTYYFDKGNLNEIDEDIYLESDSSAAKLLERLTEHLTSKYGDYASQNDSRVWNTTHNGKKEWITLSDQSEEYDNGKLLLVLYSEEY